MREYLFTTFRRRTPNTYLGIRANSCVKGFTAQCTHYTCQ